MGWGFIYLVASGDHIRGAEVGGLVCNAVALDLILKWVEASRWNSKGCVDEEEESKCEEEVMDEGRCEIEEVHVCYGSQIVSCRYYASPFLFLSKGFSVVETYGDYIFVGITM